MLDRKLIITFFATFIVAFVLLMPARFFISDASLPDGVSMNIHRGTLWQGNADVYVGGGNEESPKATQILLLNWQLCGSGSFPFFAYCLAIKNSGKDHSIKLVGLPGAKLNLRNIMSEIDMSFIIQQLNLQGLSLLNLRGSLDLALNKLLIDTTTNLPLEWDGRMTLNSGGFFNVDFPPISMIMSQREFISRDESSQAFGNNKLPTMIIQGSDDTMTLDGTLQILPDNQAKLSLEILARNELVEKTFAPLASNREGRKIFITYQGALGPAPNAGADQQAN